MGLDSTTDVTVDGVRTKHDIDVLVQSHHVGFDITWIVECKHWKSRVSKLHVLALREIVTDIGADRGILLSESGFQSGAFEAAKLTNVQVTSIEELRKFAEESFRAMRFCDLYDRVDACEERYWDIPKHDRIEAGLRPEVGGPGYSGQIIINVCRELLTRAFRGTYPFHLDTAFAIATFGDEALFETSQAVEEVVDEMVSDLERRLDQYDS